MTVIFQKIVQLKKIVFSMSCPWARHGRQASPAQFPGVPGIDETESLLAAPASCLGRMGRKPVIPNYQNKHEENKPENIELMPTKKRNWSYARAGSGLSGGYCSKERRAPAP
jgi:hypothetical protein